MPETLYCSDFIEAPNCCTSCHEDEEQGWTELTELQKDGQTAQICCAVSEYLQKKGWDF